MKRFAYILAAAMILPGVSACNQDHEPEWSETAPFDIKVVDTSITDGQEVSPETTEISVTYDHDIALSQTAVITLDGMAAGNPRVVDGNRLVADISLSKGKRYVFHIPADAVAGVGSKTFAPELTITFSTGAINIIDKSKLTASLVNANATAQAKKLFEVFISNYGEKQISGVMGGVAWDTQFSDLVYQAAGKYPAIVGFDYIHLASSPSNWIDYGDITPVKSVWEAGSVPAMTWHWNVPIAEGSSELNASQKITIDGNEVENQFKASNVLVDGTWENTVATADVEKLAGYLALLQDAGIPVIWRPFHEAAGDYSWGAWFWWGNSGVDVTKQLWGWLYDKLTVEYGLNNLIWVWTVQTSDAGQLASADLVKSAYPGDDKVDMVGADLYVEPLTNQTGQFELLYNLVEGKKMVALSECGNLLDVESAFSDGALWSYFMSWYEMPDGEYGFKDWNLNNEWKTVLDNPRVINRGDVEF